MNTFFALALACTLSTAPKNDDKLTSREQSTFVVTDNLAIWVTQTGKLKLAMGQQATNAVVMFRSKNGTLYTETINLRKGAHQTFDISELENGTYEIQVKIGSQVTTKSIHIERVEGQTIRLS